MPVADTLTFTLHKCYLQYTQGLCNAGCCANSCGFSLYTSVYRRRILELNQKRRLLKLTFHLSFCPGNLTWQTEKPWVHEYIQILYMVTSQVHIEWAIIAHVWKCQGGQENIFVAEFSLHHRTWLWVRHIVMWQEIGHRKATCSCLYGFLWEDSTSFDYKTEHPMASFIHTMRMTKEFSRNVGKLSSSHLWIEPKKTFPTYIIYNYTYVSGHTGYIYFYIYSDHSSTAMGGHLSSTWK